ncbi:MAG TPA: VWA domain-containing protein, partial [Pirellulales bacterium]|nr:VWA domain-containing protein [Pirellulales bacterium]
QRMRQSLLLFLQLLLLAIVALALLRPNWEGGRLAGDRYIFLVDNSASMNATDVVPTRLDEAKRRVEQLLDQMDSGSKGMIISFSDTAQVEQSYTDNVQELRRALAAIRPTIHSTSLDEALRLAAGLANPSTSIEIGNAQLAEPLPAKLYILSDGRFPDVRGFSLGNLEPEFVPIGMADAANVGIIAFTTGRSELHPDQLQAFARLENHGAEPVTVNLELYLDGQLLDARHSKIAAGEAASEAFGLGSVDRGVLRLAVTTPDVFMQDNQAWAVINPSRRARVLLVTSGNEPLQRALTVPSAQQWAEVTEIKPDALKNPEQKKLAAAGAFDLVIYDRCRPEQMPQANTWFIGAVPPLADWSASDPVVQPQIIDSDRSHPITQGIELGDVDVLEGRPLKAPPGATRLIDSNKGILMAISPREGFEDAVLGIDLLKTDEHGEAYANTNWPIKLSFPLFVSNLLQYFGRNQQASAGASYHPGQPVVLRSDSAAPLVVRTPSGESAEIPRSRQSTFNFAQTDQLGVYEVREAGKATQQFAVNLFDSRESDIRARTEGSIKIGFSEVTAQSRWEPARREIWKFLLVLALGVLLFEWYIYNRRVYL